MACEKWVSILAVTGDDHRVVARELRRAGLSSAPVHNDDVALLRLRNRDNLRSTATLEKELLRSRSFKTRQDAKTAIFDWIEAWYNPARRHSRLGYRSPDQYERDHDWESLEGPDMNYRHEEQNAA